MGIYSGLNYNCVIKIRLLQTAIRMSFPIRLFLRPSYQRHSQRTSIYLPFALISFWSTYSACSCDRTQKNNIFATVCKSNLLECYCCAFKRLPFFSMHVNGKKSSGEKKEHAIADKYSFFFQSNARDNPFIVASFLWLHFLLCSWCSQKTNFGTFFTWYRGEMNGFFPDAISN